jgi:hypothetical protein
MKRGDRVVLTTLGYKDRCGTLDHPAQHAKDGTPQWRVVLLGQHTFLTFREDEFRPITEEEEAILKKRGLIG